MPDPGEAYEPPPTRPKVCIEGGTSTAQLAHFGDRTPTSAEFIEITSFYAPHALEYRSATVRALSFHESVPLPV